MRTVAFSVVLCVALAALCAGMPAELDLGPEYWFPSSAYLRQRRAIGDEQKPLNASTHVPPEHANSVCIDMMPLHGNSKPQTSLPPYTISVDKHPVKPGEIVTVTVSGVSGVEPFKGVYIQGRKGDVPVGTFQEHEEPAVAISDCHPGTDNALLYVNRVDIKKLVMKWKAPDTPGKVTFKCTVVKSFSVFWLNVKSEEIEIVA